MGAQIPIMIGKGGIADAEVFVLGDSANVLVGRSRTCEISYQRFEYFVALPDAKRKEIDQQNNAVGRQHLRVQTQGVKLRLENLGAAGSYCNDLHFTGVHEIDLGAAAVILRLGRAAEAFEVKLVDEEQIDQVLSDCAKRRRERLKEIKPAPGPAVPRTIIPEAPTQAAQPILGPCVIFAGASGLCTVPFSAASVSEALEGVNPPFDAFGSCHGAGACQSCKYKIVKGVEYVVWTDESLKGQFDPGVYLGCQCVVKGPVQLERVTD